MGVWFALTPFILHRLGPTQFGIWALVGSLLAYGELLDLGVGAAVTKYVAEYRAREMPDRASSLVATALRLYLAIGGLVLALSVPMALVAPAIFEVPSNERTTLSWVIVLAGLGIAVQMPANTTYAVLRGLRRYDLINLIGSLATLVLAAATAVVLVLGGGVVGMMAVMAPLIVLWQIPLFVLVRRSAPELRLGWRGARMELVRTVAGFSWSVFLVNAAGRIKKKSDEIVIATALPLARVTPYAVARRLSDVPELVAYQYVRVLMPLASELHGRESRERLRELYIASTRLAVAIFMGVGGALVVLAKPLLVAWVGARYADSADIVLILVGSGLLEVVLWPAVSVLQGIGRVRAIAWFSAGSAALNLGLSVVFVRSMGIEGVALGTLLATTAEVLIVLPYALTVNRVSSGAAIFDILLPALTPAVPMLVCLFALRELVTPASLLALAPVGGAGALVYATGYFWLRVPSGGRSEALRLGWGNLRRGGAVP